MTSENEQWLRRQEAVEGALRHRDEERRKGQKVTRRNRQTPCCRKGEFEAVIYICCGLLGVSAVAMVIPFSIVFLHSNEDLVKRFAEGSCTVVRYNDTGVSTSCKCTQGRWCISSFPCFILYATLEYTDDDGRDQKLTTQLYDNMYGVSNEKKCSFEKCYKDELANKRAVRGFTRTWSEIGRQTTCYYDTRNPQRSSMDKPVIVPIRWDFFPFVVAIGGVAIFCLSIVFFVCCLYGCKDCYIWVKENNQLCPRPHYGD